MRRMLDPSTKEFIKRWFNEVVGVVGGAAIFAIGWIALMAIAVVLDFALKYTLEAMDAPDFIRSLLSLMLWITLVVLGLAITITSVREAINLAMASLKNPFKPKDGSQR